MVQCVGDPGSVCWGLLKFHQGVFAFVFISVVDFCQVYKQISILSLSSIFDFYTPNSVSPNADGRR